MQEILLLLCLSTLILCNSIPFSKGPLSVDKYNLANEFIEMDYLELDERATPPASWNCSASYYDSQDGCDCGCGAPDPDCDNSTATVYGCDGSQICKDGACTYPVPDGWDCDPAYYNATDGCDCECGIYDPDCSDPLTLIYNCNTTEYRYPYCTDRGECGSLSAPPARLAIQNEAIYFAQCGKTLSAIRIILLDEDFNEVEDTRGQTVTVTATAKSNDPTVNVTLAGRTTVTAVRGVAVFDGIIVLGTAGGEFTLTFSSNPVYISVSPIFRVRLLPGIATTASISPYTGVLQNNGSVTIPASTPINALITVRDQCGNRVASPPVLDCLTMDHFSLQIFNDSQSFCPDGDEFKSDTNVTIETDMLGTFNLFFKNETVNNYVGVYGALVLNVIPQSEYKCFALKDASKGVTGNDVANFDNLMVSNSSYARIQDLLFSIDDSRPSVIAFNFSQSTSTNAFHAPLEQDYKDWVLASKHFFVEQNPQFLNVISLTLVEVEASKVNVSLQLPFCGSITKEMQKKLIGLWLFALSDSYAAFAAKATDATSNNVRSTSDVVCSNKYPNYNCCPRSSLETDTDTCAAPIISPVSIALIVLSIVFAIIAAIYVSSLVAVFAVHNGAVESNMEDFMSLSEDDFVKKRRIAFLFTLLAPVVVVCGTAQTILLIETGRSFSGLRILVGIVEGVIVAGWYGVAFYSFFSLYVRRTEPSKRADRIYFAAAIVILWLSLFHVFWTFAWVTLGLLLNPERVVAYFVAFLTIFLVAAFKLQSLVQFMNTVEVQLQKQLFKRLIKKETIKDDELELLLAETVDLDNTKLRGFLEGKGFNSRDVEVVATQIEKYRRFRVRFIIGNVIGTLFFLTSLIIFILLGVEAFRAKSGLVSGVGSVLEGLSGVGAAVNDKMGNNEQKVRELVGQFAKKRAKIDSIAPEDVPLQTVNDA